VPPRIDFTSQRLFVDAPLVMGAELKLDRDQSNYLVNVLRMRGGECLLVFNGRDGEWRATLSGADKKAAALTLTEQVRPQTPPTQIALWFAPLKSARLDYLVQKAVEMGASEIRPVITRRTQVQRLKLERMQANIIEAAEQCGVLALPMLMPEQKLDAALAGDPERPILFCDEWQAIESPGVSLAKTPRGSAVTVLIGPEGGFDPDERRMILARQNTIALSLGPRILRADTAAVAAMAVAQAWIGDWG
jgi:16S rRNA (uracil1498-N3)-methyltransferase